MALCAVLHFRIHCIGVDTVIWVYWFGDIDTRERAGDLTTNRKIIKTVFSLLRSRIHEEYQEKRTHREVCFFCERGLRVFCLVNLG